MITVKTFISAEQPSVPDGLWLKPAGDSFEIYLIEGGSVKPFKAANNAPAKKDDTKDIKSALVGSAQDSKSKNTIYGAKAYAKEQVANILGEAGDTASDMTLYGLKKYVDSKTAKAKK